MVNPIVDVLSSGAVCLGSAVVCDGFVEGYPIRVQTHVHDDHMSDFATSKGCQDLLMTPETYLLLVSDRNADLEYRDNFHPIKHGDKYRLSDGSKLSLLPSNHMLGSCQVGIELSDGYRIGYSGDFGWPLQEVIKVDELVLDSTYGSPGSVRHYTQGEAEEGFLELACERLRHGPLHVKAYRGTIERVLEVLWGGVSVPILASKQLIREVEVYQEYGFAIGHIDAFDSPEGQNALKNGRFVRLYSKGDGYGNEPMPNVTRITCSAYMMTGANRSPLMKFSDRAYSVALSNHADFNETLEYVKETGAKRVVTDNTRSHGCELAIAINQRLSGVCATPSTNKPRP